MKYSYGEKLFLFYTVCALVCSVNLHAIRYIFQSPAPQTGDNLVSLYNAYVYAKKYNLTLALVPFKHCELFECYHLLPQLPEEIWNNRQKIVSVTREKDLIKYLRNPSVHFSVHVLSERLSPRPEVAAEAKKLLLLNQNIDLSYLKKNTNAFTIAVHIRKGNGGGELYDGQLYSEQIFDFDRALVQYVLDKTGNPFNYFEVEEQLSCTKQQFPLGSPDIYWKTKFPPEQYYIDQINTIAATIDTDIVVRVFTDDKDPVALVTRLKQHITNTRITIEYHDNRSSGYTRMMAEDLYLMTHCDALIRSTSRFSILAEVMGNFKMVLFPIQAGWIDKKRLVIYKVGIRKDIP